MKGKAGRPPIIESPEAKVLRLRVMAFRRKERPSFTKGDKHAWVTEFLALYEAKAWEVMQPPETRMDFLHHWNLAEPRVSEMRKYIQVFEAAVEAGVNPYHLRFFPIRALLELQHLVGKPNLLVEALLGSKAAAERKRLMQNRAARAYQRRKRAKTSSSGPTQR